MRLHLFEICSRLGCSGAAAAKHLVLALLLAGLPGALSAQTLQHEWSFNESSGTTAFDSIGSSNITLLGGCSLGGGVLTLPGGSGNYAQFPNGILTTYNNSITLETWLTDNQGQTWARAWSFGGGTSGPNNNSIGNNYIDLIPTAGGSGGFWTEFNHNGNTDAEFATPLPTGVEEYAAVVYDAPSQTARLYLNGALVAVATGIAFKPSDLGFTYNNYLGKDQYNDPTFNGTYDEIRIWNGAVSQRYLSASAAAGPGVIINNLTPTSANLSAPPTVVLTGTEPAVFTVRLPQTGSTDLIATSDATNWASSNPSVITVSSNGVINGVGLGTAKVSATIGGVAATSGQITVVPQNLQHEWSFNESGGSTAFDAVGGANITLQGSSSLGGGVLNLPGGSGNYAQFPDGILMSNYSITIETWLTDNGGQTWARAWSFGGSTNGPNSNKIGNNYVDLIPRAGGVGGMWAEFKSAAGAANDVVSPGNIPLQTGTERYIAVIYNAQLQTCSVYSNGIPLVVGTSIAISPASLGFTYNNYLGNDQYNDPMFNGSFDEMRIWDGVETPAYFLSSAAAGPGVVITNPIPQSLAVSAGTSLLGSQTEQATATANFAQISNVSVNTAVTNWVSSNPGILTVNSSGLITGVSGGSATVSATINGVTGVSPAISVSQTPVVLYQYPSNETAVVGDHVALFVGVFGGGLSYQWSLNGSPIASGTNAILALTDVGPAQGGTYSVSVVNAISSTNVSAVLSVVQPILQHEWSFNESGGTTAFDSLGGSNITLLGNASLGSGSISLSGGSTDYAQFPNGMLSTYSNSITIEAWFTDLGPETWGRVFSFGGDITGPNNNKIGRNYIDLIPHAGNANGINGGFWAEFNHAGTNTDAFDSTPVPTGVEEYAAVTYEVWDQTVRLFLNGVQVGMATNVIFSPSDMGFTYNNYLGNDQYNDPTFNGNVDELRIWNGAVTRLYLLVSAAAGPGVIVNNLTPSSVTVSAGTSPVQGQTEQANVAGNFAQASGVDLTSLVTNWVSGNPSVVTVNSNGLITAVGVGSTTVTAYLNGGLTATSPTITVAPHGPVITQEPPPFETLLVGGTLRASLAAAGTPPFTYFWYFNGGTTPISVSASPILTVPNLQLSSACNYLCLVSNQISTATSTPLNLTVVAPSSFQQTMLAMHPIAFWPLDEPSGTNAFDVIGGNNGTYNGNYAQGQAGPPNPFFGGATSVAFDGASGYVDIPGAALNITAAVTIMAWVNVLSAPGFDGLFGRGDTSWRLTINAQGQPGGNIGSAQGDATDSIVSPGLYDGNWHMVAYTYSGTTGQNNNGTLYVDAVLVANNTITTAPPGNSLDAWIGGSPDYNNRFLPADIANVAIFGEALTSAQVQGIYTNSPVLGQQFITIAHNGSNVSLSWQNGTLLQATNLLGPWTTNASAVSGYTVPATSGSMFFKLLVNP